MEKNKTIRALLTVLIAVCFLGTFSTPIVAQITDTGMDPILDLEARAKDTKVGLTWTLPLGAASTNVYRASEGGDFVLIASTTSTYATYLDQNVSLGNHVYMVRWVDARGQESPDSNLAEVCVGMEPISDLYARAKDTKVGLTWTLPLGAASTNVYRASEGGDFVLIASTTSTYATYLDQNVSLGNHVYMVRWVDARGQESPDSNLAEVCVGMEPISDLYARAKNTKVGLTWTLPLGAVSSNVYRASEGGDFVLIANTTSTYATYLDRNVPLGNHIYMVRWVDLRGQESPDSNAVDVLVSGRRR